MSKSLDNQLANFTDMVIEGKYKDKPESVNMTDDITSFQEIVVNLQNIGNSEKRFNSQRTILKSLKNDWPHETKMEKVSWRSSRRRSTSMSLAIAFAIIIIVAIIVPQLQNSEGSLPAAANGDYFLPLLLLIGFITAAYVWISKKKGN